MTMTTQEVRMKINQILDEMTTEEAAILQYLLETQLDSGGFKVGAPAIAKLLSEHTNYEVSNSAVLRWRRKYVQEVGA